MNQSTQQPARKVRFGLMMARIGSSHTIKILDGIVRQYKVKDKTRHTKAQCEVICFFCNKKYADVEEMTQDHPEEHILKKQEEKHIYAFWSNDPLIPAVPVEGGKKEDKPQREKDPTKVIGLLSTEE